MLRRFLERHEIRRDQLTLNPVVFWWGLVCGYGQFRDYHLDLLLGYTDSTQDSLDLDKSSAVEAVLKRSTARFYHTPYAPF